MSNELESDRASTPIRRVLQEIGGGNEELNTGNPHLDVHSLTLEELYSELSPSLRWYLERNHARLINELLNESVEIIELSAAPPAPTEATRQANFQIGQLIESTQEASEQIFELEQLKNQQKQEDTVSLDPEASTDNFLQEQEQEQSYPEGSLAIQIGEGQIDFLQLDQYLEELTLSSSELLWVVDLRQTTRITPMLLGVLYAYRQKIEQQGKRMVLLVQDMGGVSTNLKQQIYKKFELL